MSLGELQVGADGAYELQLKGCGRSPFSRGFDGKAVVRSSIREFLASEAMHHLNVSTTRALCVIGTGDQIQRPWYEATSTSSPEDELKRRFISGKYPPNILKSEAGAVVCRVSPSFFRFGHLELFAIRGEFKELIELADYICRREFPHLLSMDIPARYVAMFREIVRSNAALVADWIRVGYVQGNMNSDNTCLNGRTIDYGPYGWVEAFDPKYQPFTSDRDGKFSFFSQPQAMQVNIHILGERAFVPLIREAGKVALLNEDKIDGHIEERYKIATMGFQDDFFSAFNEVRRRKLGFKAFSNTNQSDEGIWTTLVGLLRNSKADYTIFFRELCHAADSKSPEEAYLKILPSFYLDVTEDTRVLWIQWLGTYLTRLASDALPADVRIRTMLSANPKYVLRNWMSVKAYESAGRGDFSVVKEILEVLADPYAIEESKSDEFRQKWYTKTPSWAESMPGCSFFSCSS